MEHIWWEKISKVNHWTNTITSTILQNKCVLLECPATLPWHDVMYNTIGSRLSEESSACSLKFIDNPDGNDVGKYLFDTYCHKAARNDYRNNIRYADFLAERDDIVINSYYIWVKNVPGDDLGKWLTFISDYNNRVKTARRMRHAVFIIETDNAQGCRTGVRGLTKISFSDSIEYYDKFTFCALASGSVTNDCLKSVLRPYLVELITTVCGDEIELYPECIRRASDFAADPAGTLEYIVNTCTRSDGSCFNISLDPGKINSLIWEAQIKLIFPAVEKFRSAFINRHFDEIESVLPCENGFGMTVNTPYEVEVNLLIPLVAKGAIAVDKAEQKDLELFRNARNNMSHLTPLSLDTVESVLSKSQV